MSINTIKYYEYKLFEPGDLGRVYKRIFDLFQINPEKAKIWLTHSLDDANTYQNELSIFELDSLVDINVRPRLLSLHEFNTVKGNVEILLRRYNDYLFFDITVDTKDYLEECYLIISEELKLKEVDKSIVDKNKISYTEELKSIKGRIDILEDMVLHKERILTCFISYRFNENDKKIAFELSRFLDLIGIDVKSGVGYEPRRISDKVMSKLNDNIDFIIYIVSDSGESMWTRDEIALSFGQDKYVIPLIEGNQKFQSGIFGDLEYINFEKGHVSDTFIGLLEAIQYIKSKR